MSSVTSALDQPVRVRFVYTHKCDLPEYVDLILPTPPPYAPFSQRICYYLRKVFTIHQTYRSSQFFRSGASMRQEKARHLTTPRYRYVIHPFSKFVRYERIVMSLIWLFLFLYHPMVGSFFADGFIGGQEMKVGYLVIGGVACPFLVHDIIMNFFLGYIIDKTREIVLDHRRVVKHYLRTYFVVDIVPFMTELLLTFPLVGAPYKFKLLSFQLTSLRLFRMKHSMQGIDDIMRFIGFKKKSRIPFIIYLSSLTLIHWWCCLMKLLNVIRREFHISVKDSWFAQLKLDREREQTLSADGFDEKMTYIQKAFQDYLQYMTVMVCHFLGAGVGNYKTHDALEMMVLAFFSICSLMIYLVSLATLLQHFGVVNTSEFKFEEIIGQVQEYMVMKRFPLSLRKRIIKYYNYKFDKKFFSEKQILQTLTEHLQMEILLYSCENMVKKVQLFRGLSRGAVGCILALLEQEIYLPTDVVMRSDDDSGTLYFILFGTCAVALVTGKESMHIEDGSLFGENREIFKSATQDFVYQVMAIEPCEIYSLAAEDIRYCCKHYPEIRTKIEAMSQRKSRVYNVALSVAAEEDVHISASDIVAELRKGRILQQRRHRLDTLHSIVD